jgi:hypothetical protein
MGVHELGIRKAVLKNAQNFRSSKAAAGTSVAEEALSEPSVDKFRDRVSRSDLCIYMYNVTVRISLEIG